MIGEHYFAQFSTEYGTLDTLNPNWIKLGNTRKHGPSKFVASGLLNTLLNFLALHRVKI